MQSTHESLPAGIPVKVSCCRSLSQCKFCASLLHTVFLIGHTGLEHRVSRGTAVSVKVDGEQVWQEQWLVLGYVSKRMMKMQQQMLDAPVVRVQESETRDP